jgi:hypothetical protein
VEIHYDPRSPASTALLISVFAAGAEARVVKLRIERRERALNGKAFGPPVPMKN